MEDRTVRKATRRPFGELAVLSVSPGIRTEVMHFRTETSEEFIDLTEIVREVVQRSEVRHGQVTVHTPHTTTTIAVNESETGFINDFRRRVEALVPKDAYYEHDDWDVRTENVQEDELVNGQSHVRQMFVGSSSVTIPIVDGEVLLGQWQRVLLVELDQPRDRRAIIHAQGL